MMSKQIRFVALGALFFLAFLALNMPAQSAKGTAWLQTAADDPIPGRWVYQAGNYRDVLTYTPDGRVVPDSSPGNVATWAVEGGELVTRWPNRFVTRLALPVQGNRLAGFIISPGGSRQPVAMTREAAFPSQEDKGRVIEPVTQVWEFRHAPNGDWSKEVAGETLNFVTWDGTKWTVKLHGNGFLLAPNGDWNKAVVDVVLRYVAWNGTNWAAKIHEGGFLHAPDGNWARAHADAAVHYLTTTRSRWSMKILPLAAPTPLPAPSGRRFQMAPEGDWERARVDDELKFIAWDGSKWSAKLAAGVFLLAPNGDWARARADRFLNYTSWDGTKWTARVENFRFVRAQDGDWNRKGPGSLIKFLAWDKSKWTGKVHEGLRGRMEK